ncbi:aminotransferase class I/II-fold pyridoxal phosphate-dependent enzyme [Microbispora siamensis]|uniref:Aminotransferase class I/II n=1 Tax=Microbispora siamensis TaxID=564413 RepID=A0ABQ4GEF3_9ACTN|nr:aminotransferase class I/II-fold pyridoxal phosphate-dependent enzyme [Microbispora siamensis]GIH59807.1 aminotransferase class I/II [Microbispora siamensis]
MGAAGKAAGPLSHRRRWYPDVVQQVAPPGTFDLGPGYLDPGLLPVDLLRGAYADALAEFGSAALSYGPNSGALPLRALLADRLGPPCTPDHIMVTSGTSHALHLIATILFRRHDVVLVEQVGYDLGRAILADSGLRLRAVEMDDSGMVPEALERALGAAGDTPAFVYLNPTFHNPTGLLVPSGRRRELLAVAAAYGVPVVEDDAYAEIGLTRSGMPDSMAALSGYRGVIRLGSFSKSLAPGLRLGWLAADPETVARIQAHHVFDSGGSPNHLASLAVTTLLATGAYDRHLTWLRSALRDRRDALAAALSANLPERFVFDRPAGGFFLWVTADGERDERGLVTAARNADVRVLAGGRFGRPARPSVRLAYSFNSPPRLTAAAHRLAAAWKSTERRLPCS